MGWELGQVLGALAGACLLSFGVTALRPRRFAFRTLSVGAHELIGWLALGASALHAAVLLAADGRVAEHVRLTAPLYEWAAILALALTSFVTVPATAKLRRRIWPRFLEFRPWHLSLAVAPVVLAAVHAVATGRYAHGPIGAAAVVFASLLAIGGTWLSRRRFSCTPAQSLSAGARLRPALLAGLALLPVVTLLGLLYPGSSLALRGPAVLRDSPLKVEFPHEKHRKTPCIQCHHNYSDRSGREACINCHRSARKDLRAGAEARLHAFCLGCHRSPPPPLRNQGPTTGCETCHPVLRSRDPA